MRKGTDPRVNRDNQRRARVSAKELVFHIFGRHCECAACPLNHGTVNPKFLTLDHVNEDAATRAGGWNKRKRGSQLWRWVAKMIRAGEPPADIQMLCMSCNHAKSDNHGVCPHVQDRELRFSELGFLMEDAA